MAKLRSPWILSLNHSSYWAQPGMCRTYGSSGAYVQKIFISYLGRPAAPAGLEYFANYLNEDNEGGKLILFDDLYYSSEARGLYSGLALEEQINKFYKFMFSRNARRGGLEYWLNEFKIISLNLFFFKFSGIFSNMFRASLILFFFKLSNAIKIYASKKLKSSFFI